MPAAAPSANQARSPEVSRAMLDGLRTGGEPTWPYDPGNGGLMDSESNEKIWPAVLAIAAPLLAVGVEALVHHEWWSGGLVTLGSLVVMAPASPFVKSRIGAAVGRPVLWSIGIATWLIFVVHVGLEFRLLEQNSVPAPPFTATGIGCTPTNVTGDGAAGTFTLAPGPCTAVMVTMGSPMAAPNGWHCDVGDRTQLAKNVWFGEWTEDASTRTTVTIPIPGAAYQDVNSKGNGGMDVISFACTEY